MNPDLLVIGIVIQVNPPVEAAVYICLRVLVLVGTNWWVEYCIAWFACWRGEIFCTAMPEVFVCVAFIDYACMACLCGVNWLWLCEIPVWCLFIVPVWRFLIMPVWHLLVMPMWVIEPVTLTCVEFVYYNYAFVPCIACKAHTDHTCVACLAFVYYACVACLCSFPVWPRFTDYTCVSRCELVVGEFLWIYSPEPRFDG